MKYLLAAILIWESLYTLGATPPATPKCSITIEAPSATVGSGAEVFIKIHLVNTWDREIARGGQAMDGVDMMYQYDCRYETGASVRKDPLGIIWAMGDRPKMKPGESHDAMVPIGRTCDLRQPGEYTIQISRSFPEESGKVDVVKSNIITITVLPEVEQPPAEEVNPLHAQPPSPDRESHAPQASAGHPSVLLAPEPEKPRFALSIQEDKEAAQSVPGLHRVVVKHTDVWIGAELDYFYKEALGMYSMIVLRDGVPVAETNAMRALRDYRKADNDYNPPNQRVLRPGESWTDALDVSDFYDMTTPGAYQITVTREPLPVDLTYSVPVRSNTITIVVPPGAGAANPTAGEKPKPKFALTLSLVNPDQFPVLARVERQNISESVIREAKCWQFGGMYNVVISRNGAPLEETAELRMLQKRRGALDCPGNETVITLDPGAVEEEEIAVSNFFDVTEPGAYTVYVTRETFPWNPAKSVPVASNTIYFVVPEPPPVEATPPDAGAGVQ